MDISMWLFIIACPKKKNMCNYTITYLACSYATSGVCYYLGEEQVLTNRSKHVCTYNIRDISTVCKLFILHLVGM